jgi:hypothetical protein
MKLNSENWQQLKNCGKEVFCKKSLCLKKHFRTVKINNTN